MGDEELARVREHLDRLAAARVSGRLDGRDLARYEALCRVEAELLAGREPSDADRAFLTELS